MVTMKIVCTSHTYSATFSSAEEGGGCIVISPAWIACTHDTYSAIVDGRVTRLPFSYKQRAIMRYIIGYVSVNDFCVLDTRDEK